MSIIFLLTSCQGNVAPNTETDIPSTETGEDEGESSPSAFATSLNLYNPLTDYDMYHEGTGLGEGMNFLFQSEEFVLAQGHQGQAVSFYRILQINEEAGTIVITHEFMEATEEFEAIQKAIDEGDDLQSLLEQYKQLEPNKEQLYFTATEVAEEITLQTGEELTVLPVHIKDTVYYFAEERGLVRIKYTGDSVIELFGEEQIAEANPHQ